MPLFELVYSSYSIYQNIDISELVNKSIIRNRENDITGCLLITESEFFQVLEGEKTVIQLLFNNIENDVRHTGVRLMWASTIQERAFGQWAMMSKIVSNNTLRLTGNLTTGKEIFDIIMPEMLDEYNTLNNSF